MSKIGKQISKTFGYISALRTMLDNYPSLKISDDLMDLLNSANPIDFILKLLTLCGLSTEELLNFISKLLCGKEALIDLYEKKGAKLAENVPDGDDDKTGFLDVVEETIKLLLLANVKDLFTCTLNPFLPSNLMRSPSDGTSFGDGINISIPTIDLYNTFRFSPLDKRKGKTFYFDVNYPSSEMWKSTDFNAFLWFIIHKSTNIGDEKLKCIWDNRVQRRKIIKKNQIFKDNFFNIFKGNNTYINPSKEQTGITEFVKDENKDKDKNPEGLLKKQFIIVEYNERAGFTSVPDTLQIWLNADRYRRKKKIGEKTFYVNKTVFEFNFDFIYSLKLFDSKTMTAKIINSLIGFGNSALNSLLSTKVTVEEEMMAAKIGQIINELVEQEETAITDCSFTFSNEQYENMLHETEIKMNEGYTFGEVNGSLSDMDMDSISKELNNIESSASLVEEEATITNIFNNIISAIPAQHGAVTAVHQLAFGNNILTELIKQLATQLVLQVFSPKVMMLYTLNSYFMGDVADGDFSKINMANFIKGMGNLIVKIVKQVFELVIKELMNFLLDLLRDLIMLLLEKLILEQIFFYIELLKNLLNMINRWLKNNKKAESALDNVTYADIIPEQNTPTPETC